MPRTKDIVSRLGEKGYRLTPQRMMVLQAIENSTNHISAEEIHAQVAAKYPHVNISTVYRTLELLKRLGMVTETDLGGGQVRYHPMEKGHHHHLVCLSCGGVTDIPDSLLYPLRDTLRLEYNFEPELKHMAIFGRCGDCRK